MVFGLQQITGRRRGEVRRVHMNLPTVTSLDKFALTASRPRDEPEPESTARCGLVAAAMLSATGLLSGQWRTSTPPESTPFN